MAPTGFAVVLIVGIALFAVGMGGIVTLGLMGIGAGGLVMSAFAPNRR